MSILYIAEFPGLASTDQSDSVPAVPVPPTAEQTVAIGSASVASAAFQPSTKWVELSTDVVCSVAFGADPTAAVTNCRLAAGERVLRRVTPGHRVSVIANT